MSMFTCYTSLLAVTQGQSFDTDTAVLYESPFLEWVSSIIAAVTLTLFLHRPPSLSPAAEVVNIFVKEFIKSS